MRDLLNIVVPFCLLWLGVKGATHVELRNKRNRNQPQTEA